MELRFLRRPLMLPDLPAPVSTWEKSARLWELCPLLSLGAHAEYKCRYAEDDSAHDRRVRFPIRGL